LGYLWIAGASSAFNLFAGALKRGCTRHIFTAAPFPARERAPKIKFF